MNEATTTLTRAGLLGTTAVRGLPLSAQHAAEGGLAGQVQAVIGQHGHRARCLGPAIARCEAFVGLPALQCAHVDAGDLAGQVQPCAGGMRNGDVLGQGLAILEADHSSSPVLKIACTFREVPRCPLINLCSIIQLRIPEAASLRCSER
jgi:hypothetical protein